MAHTYSLPLLLASDLVNVCVQLSTTISFEIELSKEQANRHKQHTIHPGTGLADIPNRLQYYRDPVARERRRLEMLEAQRVLQEHENRIQAEKDQREAERILAALERKALAAQAQLEKDRQERLKEYQEFKQRKADLKAAIQSHSASLMRKPPTDEARRSSLTEPIVSLKPPEVAAVVNISTTIRLEVDPGYNASAYGHLMHTDQIQSADTHAHPDISNPPPPTSPRQLSPTKKANIQSTKTI